MCNQNEEKEVFVENEEQSKVQETSNETFDKTMHYLIE
jgi:hypothetical protein